MPPVAGTTNRPPLLRSERKTSRVPSADQFGCQSCAASVVHLHRMPPSTGCTQTSKLPDLFDVGTDEGRAPSGDNAGSVLTPESKVRRVTTPGRSGERFRPPVPRREREDPADGECADAPDRVGACPCGPEGMPTIVTFVIRGGGLRRAVELGPRVADVAQAAPRILLETALEQSPDGAASPSAAQSSPARVRESPRSCPRSSRRRTRGGPVSIS